MKIGYLVIKHFDDTYDSVPDTVFYNETEAHEYAAELNEQEEDDYTGDVWQVDQVKVVGF